MGMVQLDSDLTTCLFVEKWSHEDGDDDMTAFRKQFSCQSTDRSDMTCSVSMSISNLTIGLYNSNPRPAKVSAVDEVCLSVP